MPGSPEDLFGLEDKHVAKDGGVISSEFGDCGGTTDLMPLYSVCQVSEIFRFIGVYLFFVPKSICPEY